MKWRKSGWTRCKVTWEKTARGPNLVWAITKASLSNGVLKDEQTLARCSRNVELGIMGRQSSRQQGALRRHYRAKQEPWKTFLGIWTSRHEQKSDIIK